MNQVAHQAGAYPGFSSMKWPGIFLLSLNGMPVHHRVTPNIYSPVPIYELCSKGYIFHHTPRANSRDGGVGILAKKSLWVKKPCSANFSFFEHMVALAEYSIRTIRIAIIYRPASSQIGAFLVDFASLLEQLAATSDNLLTGFGKS